MKSKLFILAALTAMSHSAVAQTTTTATALPAGSGASTATTTAAAPASGLTPNIKYLGFLYGPGMDFSGSHEADTNGNNSLGMQHRPQFLIKTNPDTSFGIETRFDTYLGKADAGHTNVYNENYILMAKFANVYQSETLSLTLLPRLRLPTSMKAHDQHLSSAPEMIAWLDYSPKDSRFSFEAGADYLEFLYRDQSASTATTAALQPWIEVDYTLSPKVTAMLSWWPDYSAKGHIGTPLAVDSNEIDTGAYFEVSKNWKINPYMAFDPYGMDSAKPLASTQFNVLFIGTIL